MPRVAEYYLQITNEAGFLPQGLICIAQAMAFHISGSHVLMSINNEIFIILIKEDTDKDIINI